MIVEIKDTLIDYISNNDNYSNVSDIIEKLVSGMKDRYYIVSMSEKMLDQIISVYVDLAKNTRIFLQNYKNNYKNLKSFYRQYKPLIVVDDVENIKRDDLEGNYTVPFSYLSNLKEPGLSCENSDDYVFYMWMYSIFSKVNTNIPNNNYIKIQNLPCGGANNLTIEAYYNNGTILSIIVDSDKYSCDSRRGDTYNAINSVYKKFKNKKVTDLYVLNSREKENLIPFEDYKLVICEKIELLDFFNTFQNDHFQAYFDIKDGIKLKKLFVHDKKWEKVNNALVDEIKKTKFFNTSNYEKYDEDKDKYANCIAIAGVGGKAVNLIMKYSENNKEYTPNYSKFKTMKSDWEQIIKFLIKNAIVFSENQINDLKNQ